MSAAASSAVIVLPGSRVVARLRKRRAADALSSRYEQAKAWSTSTPACCSASTVSRSGTPVYAAARTPACASASGRRPQ